MGEVRLAAGLPGGACASGSRSWSACSGSSPLWRRRACPPRRSCRRSSTPFPSAGNTRSCAGLGSRYRKAVFHTPGFEETRWIAARPAQDPRRPGRLGRGLLLRKPARPPRGPLPARGEEAYRAHRDPARPPVRGVGSRRPGGWDLCRGGRGGPAQARRPGHPGPHPGDRPDALPPRPAAADEPPPLAGRARGAGPALST